MGGLKRNVTKTNPGTITVYDEWLKKVNAPEPKIKKRPKPSSKKDTK